MARRLKVAVVGLQFGAEFVPIYKDHPLVSAVVVADLDRDRREDVSARFGVEVSYGSLEETLADDDVDAVHIVTGFTSHAADAIAAFEAGKHVACTVPMGLSLEELSAVLEAEQRSRKSYMMMETAVFTREFLWAAEVARKGELGTVSYGRGTHFQDMTGWPPYWLGLPPMHYATHAVSPLLALLGAKASGVRAVGGGVLDEANRGPYGQSFPVECAHVTVDGSAAVIEVARSLYQVARQYTESFAIYGDRKGIEWPQLDTSPPEMVLYELGPAIGGRGKPLTVNRVVVPDRTDLLPEPLRRYTTKFVYGEESGHRSFVQGGGHGGSHPHLVHEFVSSVTEGRKPAVDGATAANWSAVGIAAHESVLLGGAHVAVPGFV